MRRPRPRRGEGRRSGAVPPPSVITSSTSQMDEVEFVIAHTGEWIRGADTKAGLSLTALTVLLAAISREASSVKFLWTDNSRTPPAIWLLIVSILALVAALVAATLVVVPRASRSAVANRFSWPWLATVTAREASAMPRETAREEAWQQAVVLAVIASRKYAWLRASLICGAVAAVAFLTWKALFQT